MTRGALAVLRGAVVAVLLATGLGVGAAEPPSGAVDARQRVRVLPNLPPQHGK